MIGFAASVVFSDVVFLGRYSPWRWMLASTAIPPAFVMAQVYFCPESPRCKSRFHAPQSYGQLTIRTGYMEKGKYDKAFNSMMRLRNHKFQAARDLYYAFKLLEVEKSEREGKNLWKEFFFRLRNRRAAQSSFFVMFMQQYVQAQCCKSALC